MKESLITRLVQRECSAAETLFLLSFNNSGEWITGRLRRNDILYLLSHYQEQREGFTSLMCQDTKVPGPDVGCFMERSDSAFPPHLPQHPTSST